MSILGTVTGVGMILLGWVTVTDKWSLFALRRRRSAPTGDRGVYFGPVDLELARRVGDLQLDLSKWIIPEGEFPVVVTRWIGSVIVYVPYDLELAIDASALFGEVDVLGERHTGIGRRARLATGGYPWAERKVRLAVSTLLGDVTVRQL
jgi:predicted membrane protein